MSRKKEKYETCPRCKEGLMSHSECDNSKCVMWGQLVFCNHLCWGEGEDQPDEEWYG